MNTDGLGQTRTDTEGDGPGRAAGLREGALTARIIGVGLVIAFGKRMDWKRFVL